MIGEDHLILERGALKSAAPVVSPAVAEGRTLREAVHRHIAQVLDEVGGNKRRAARELGVSRATLDRHLLQQARGRTASRL